MYSLGHVEDLKKMTFTGGKILEFILSIGWLEIRTKIFNVYFRYSMARLQPYNNVILDVSKEAGSYGVGLDYVHDRLTFMHSVNSHNRIITAHGHIRVFIITLICIEAKCLYISVVLLGPGGTSWPASVCPTKELDLCQIYSLQRHYNVWVSIVYGTSSCEAIKSKFFLSNCFMHL